MQNSHEPTRRRSRAFPWKLIVAFIVASATVAPAYIQLLLPAKASTPERIGSFRPGSADRTLLPLTLGDVKEEEQTLWLDFEVNEARRLASAAAVDLELATHDEAPALISGRIDIEGWGCSFVTAPDRTLWNNTEQRFSRQGECAANELSLPRRARLTLVTTGGRDIAVAAMQPRSPEGVDGYLIAPLDWRAHQAAPLLLQGKILPDSMKLPRSSRLHVLLHVWELDSAKPVVLLGLFLVFALLMLAAYSALRYPTRRGLGLAVGAAALAFASAYALVTPPFQAQDEPNHFLSYLSASQSEAQTDDAALALANRGHFTRLRMQPGESLTVYDTQVPRSGPWPANVRALAPEQRTFFTQLTWRALTPLTAQLTVSQTLLVLRCLNALVFAIVLGLAASLVLPRATMQAAGKPSAGDGVPIGAFAALTFLLIPAYPFWAMAASGTAPLAIMAALLGISSCSFVSRSDGTPAVFGLAQAALMGAVAGVLALQSRSGLVAPPFVVAIVCFSALAAARGRKVSSSPRSSSDEQTSEAEMEAAQLPSRPAYGFLLLGVCLLSLTLVLSRGGSAFVQGLLDQFAGERAARAVPAAWHIWLPALASAGVFLLMAPLLWRAFRHEPRHAAKTCSRRWAMGVLIGAVLAGLYAWWQPASQLPKLHASQQGFSGGAAYLAASLQTLLHGLGLGTPDFNLTTSLWGGFGWLDTLPSLTLIGWLRGFTVAGIAVGAAVALTSGDPYYPRRGFALASLLVCFAALAVGSFVFQGELQGRSLIVWNALFLPLALAGWYDLMRDIDKTAHRQSARIIGVTVVLALGLFAFQHCLATLVRRYYGA